MTNKTLCFSLFIFLSWACSSSHKDDHVSSGDLVKANEFHQSALDLREELIDLEAKLKEAEVDYSDLKEDLKVWDKDIIEVPGFEHSHAGEPRRFHVHNPMQQFSDEEHLAYQKMMYDEIVEIHRKMTEKISLKN